MINNPSQSMLLLREDKKIFGTLYLRMYELFRQFNLSIIQLGLYKVYII